MNRNEIKKAGRLVGIEVDYFGDVVSSKTRKFYNSIAKAKGQNLTTFKKLVQEAKKLNIFDITVLKCDEWIGEYGLVVSDLCCMNEYRIRYDLHADVKYIWNIIRGLCNSHKIDKYIFVPVETVDGSTAYNLFYIPEGFKIIKYGPADSEFLIAMHNGQYFDVGYSYYYSKKDSKILREEMKKGYVYECPSYFYNYIEPYEESEDYDESEYGSPE